MIRHRRLLWALTFGTGAGAVIFLLSGSAVDGAAALGCFAAYVVVRSRSGRVEDWEL